MQRRFDTILHRLTGLVANDSSRQFLLAVSGGADSMCLAQLFSASALSPRFAVAHCNFSLRGEESDADEAFVRAWAEDHGVRFFSRRFDTEAYAEDKGISIEMAARELRYAWFNELCLGEGFEAVCVAHNLNDNAETLVLNLLRGTGSRGLCGMAPKSSVPVQGGVTLLRPLLEFSRKEILSFLETGHREDRTNADSIYKRNKIRNQVFPLFEEINPSFLQTFGRNMEIFREVDSIAEDYFTAASEKVCTFNGQYPTVDIDLLRAQPHWQYILFRIAEPLGFCAASVDDMARLLEEGTTLSGHQFFSSSCRAYTTARSIVFACRNEADFTQSLMIEGEGEYEVCGTRFRVEVLPWSGNTSPKQAPGVLIVDASRLKFPFEARGWRDGDWMVPLGMRGRKKLSDLFVDLKFSIEDKRHAVVIKRRDEEKSAVLVGQRIDDSYKVNSGTVSVLRISLT